jgi:hypothetical protein
MDDVESEEGATAERAHLGRTAKARLESLITCRLESRRYK